MSTRERRSYDVVIVSDFRFSGGNSATNATEIQVQAQAGYRTALVHLPSPLLRSARPFSPRIRECLDQGLATLELPDRPLRTRLLIVRQPTVLARVPATVPDIEADVKLLVANAPPSDGVRPEPYYDVAAVDRVAADLFGPGVAWAPIGPVVREQLRRTGVAIPFLDRDWHNVIDLDAWASPRPAFVADRPVIGRHSRDHRQKWPASPGELLAAYPEHGGMLVRVLGGAEAVRSVLGYVPESWDVLPFDAMAPQQFLAGVDFVVYFPHPGWHEAFGRTVLEALASGAVALVPRPFEPLFGPGCLYCTPGEVQPLVRELYGDRPAYERRAEAGRSVARERFDIRVHARRLEQLIGPARAPAPVAVAAPEPARHILFVTAGGGLGHLTRMLAVARRAPSPWRPVFLTQSESFGVARDAGFPVEYVPARKGLGWDPTRWNRLLRERLLDAIATWEVEGVVFDGTMPYRGLLDIRELRPDLPLIWCRRGMWKEGSGSVALERSAAFDLIIEPGELASDTGVTARAGGEVARVDPITMLDPEDLVDRRVAAERLGLDPDRPAALVQLSAFDIETLRSRAALVIDRLLALPDMQVCVPHSLMLGRAVSSNPLVVRPRVYPLSSCFAAFSFAVAAAGYNLFHELVRFAVPTLFIPLAETATDDQLGRARWAEQAGVGLCLLDQDVDAARLDANLRMMTDAGRLAAMQERARAAYPPANGAEAAMQLIEQRLAPPVTAPAVTAGGAP